MAHECPECGALCYCDIEDMIWDEAPDNCGHRCHSATYDDDLPEPDPEPDRLSRDVAEDGTLIPAEFPDDDETEHDFTEEDVVI